VNFTIGEHGTLLNPASATDPLAYLPTTREMQTETVLFTAGNPLVPIPPGTIVPGAFTPDPVQP
jgi:hypothetical protein